MTEDEIMDLPAGRQLEALIAEHVMGWHRLPALADYQPSMGEAFLVSILAPCRPSDPGIVYRVAPTGMTSWRPSTDIAAAWEVIRACRARDWWWQIESHHGKDGGWKGSVWTDHKSDPEETRAICWEAETPELAICRAALLGAVLFRRATDLASRK